MKATDILTRKAIIARKEAGETLLEISNSLSISYRTVVNLWQKYKKNGFQIPTSNYSNCGRHQSNIYSSIKQVCLLEKGLHERWGAPRIHHELCKKYPSDKVPSIRTLQSWYREANLTKPRFLNNEHPIGSAKAVHNIWQVDAKERLVLLDGQEACYLTIVDDKSGACLEALVFPLSQNQSSSSS
jgi:hypothetical protein